MFVFIITRYTYLSIQIFLPQLHFEQGVICCDALEIFG
mgnify:CR=1 FL=1